MPVQVDDPHSLASVPTGAVYPRRSSDLTVAVTALAVAGLAFGLAVGLLLHVAGLL